MRSSVTAIRWVTPPVVTSTAPSSPCTTEDAAQTHFSALPNCPRLGLT
jgi:hypothetical protein